MIKKVWFSMIAFCSCAAVYAQEQIGVGAIIGITTYLGDFNNSSIISNPDIIGGGFVRYALDDYYHLRLNVAGGFMRGNPDTYKGSLIEQNPTKIPTAFRTFFFDADVRVEAGFLPYNPFKDRGIHRFSPYYTLGAGLLYCRNSPTLQIPMGFGIKYRLAYRWTMNIEWIFAKTFTDNIDEWKNVRESKGFSFTNHDWLTYLSFNITYQLFDDRVCQECSH